MSALPSTYIGQNAFDNLKNRSSTETNTPITRINKAICMSGGGSFASTFALGAARRMNECDLLLDADVYSCASGSTFLMHLLQLCILDKIVYKPGPENKYRNPVDRSWYDKYIRTTAYAAYADTLYMTVAVNLLNPYNAYKFTDTVIRVFSDFESKFPEFYQLSYADVDKDPHQYLYAYINAVNYQTTNDNSDLINSSTPITSVNWGWRILRSTFPILFHKGVVSVDSGLIDNNGILPVLDVYSPKELYVITVLFQPPNLPKTVSVPSVMTLLSYVFNNLSQFANGVVNTNLMKGYRDYILNDDAIQIAQSVYPSHSQFATNSAGYTNGFVANKGIFDSFYDDVGTIKRDWNGLFFYEEDMIRIIENEGYSQMDIALNVQGKVPADATPFNVPNPDYNDYTKVKAIHDAFIAKSATKLVLNSLVKTLYQVYPKTSLLTGITFVAGLWSIFF
jgi:hypothetical protein